MRSLCCIATIFTGYSGFPIAWRTNTGIDSNLIRVAVSTKNASLVLENIKSMRNSLAFITGPRVVYTKEENKKKDYSDISSTQVIFDFIQQGRE